MKRVCAYVLGLAIVATGVGQAAGLAMPVLPPLNDPPTRTELPGKFIWSDYFTSDVDAARKFYAALFGWEWREVNAAPDARYGMFYEDGVPVAGVAFKAAQDPQRPYGRWIQYISVADVATTVRAVEARGGRTLLSPRSYPNRGSFAVVADPEAAPFGVMHSSSGDPLDYRAGVGEWIWSSLFAVDASAAIDFYRGLFGYQVYAPDPEYGALEHLLSSGGFARAAVRELPKDSSAHPSWVAYVRVADVAAAASEAQRLGGSALLGPDPSVLNGDLAIVADPLGAPIGLIRWTYEDTVTGDIETPDGARP